MKVLIINANPKETYEAFDLYLEALKASLEEKMNEVKVIPLRRFSFHDCIGCYSCWLKTPGICCFQDGMEEILKEYLAADTVVFASPIIMGFISASLKCVNDRMLPVMHPFLQPREDRMSHFLRYSHYPEAILLLDDPRDGAEGTNGSIALIEKVYENSQRGMRRFLNTGQSIEEVSYAIVHH